MLKNFYYKTIFTFALFFPAVCFSWGPDGWNGGSRFLRDGLATFSYDTDNDAWISGKPIVINGSTPYIRSKLTNEKIDLSNDGYIRFIGQGGNSNREILLGVNNSSAFITAKNPTDNSYHRWAFGANSCIGVMRQNHLTNSPSNRTLPTTLLDPTLRLYSADNDSVYGVNYYGDIYFNSNNNLPDIDNMFTFKAGFGGFNFILPTGGKIAVGDVNQRDLFCISPNTLYDETKIYAHNGIGGPRIIFCHYNDRVRDIGYSDPANPTLTIQSGATNSTTSQSVSIWHDGTDANISTGSGDIKLDAGSDIIDVDKITRYSELSVSTPSAPASGKSYLYIDNDGDLAISTNRSGTTKKIKITNFTAGNVR